MSALDECGRGDYVEMCDEIDQLRALNEELEGQLDYLRTGCMKLTRDELIRKITEVGEESWNAGLWLDRKVAPYRSAAEQWNYLCVIHTKYADVFEVIRDLQELDRLRAKQ